MLEALDRREPLQADGRQSAYRVFHGYTEGCPGLCVDRFGDALVATHGAELEADGLNWIEPLVARLSPSLVVAKARRGLDPRLIRGQAAETLQVVDTGLTFEIEPMARRNVGLYLDARPARTWLRENSEGRRVLNLFAYTGSLGLAAAAGGARWVMHVELQKRQLRRAKRNHDLNGLPIDDRNLIREDLYKYLRRAGKKKRLQVDGVILDPPPMVPGRGSHRPPGQDYATLVPLATPLLSVGGWLLCFFHRHERTRADAEAEVLRASTVPLEVLWRGTSGVDFPEDDPQAKLRFTAFARSEPTSERP
jgi:23S rRNA (cytosine1962-C5)-methyltransferase